MIYTVKETNDILRLATQYSKSNYKQISDKIGISRCSLYSWRTNINNYLSAKNTDALIEYFRQCEPDALDAACAVYKQKKTHV